MSPAHIHGPLSHEEYVVCLQFGLHLLSGEGGGVDGRLHLIRAGNLLPSGQEHLPVWEGREV